MPFQVPPPAAAATTVALFVVSLVLTEEGAAAAVAAELQVRSAAAATSPEHLGPPRELGPVPPADDEPLLRAAGARRLAFFVRYDCPDMQCPSTVFWRYRKLGVENWSVAERSETYSGKDHFNSTTTLNNLSPETLYEILALPVKENTANSGPSRFPLWFPPSIKPPVATALTCTPEVASVQDLLVHSSGSGWLALSWIPPAPKCSTLLDYSARYTTSSSDGNNRAQVHATHWRWVGRFGTAEPSRTDGPVIPCAAWPDRHCLLIARQLQPNHSYSVQIQVERRIDDKNSQPQEAQGWTREDIAPGAPVKLQCQALGPRRVKASWRPPLRPGGRLEESQVFLSGSDGEVRTIRIGVTLQQEYVLEMKHLRPSTYYHVRVRFVSASKTEGALAIAYVTTEPDDGAAMDDERGPSMSLQSPPPPPPPHSPQTASDSSGDAWLWLAGVLTAFALLPIAFVIGCRSGRKWASNSAEERKLVMIAEEKRDHVSSDSHKEEPKYYYATSTALAAASPPPRSPPPPSGAAPPIPASVLVVPAEYAEPHVSPLESGGNSFWDAAYAYPCSEDAVAAATAEEDEDIYMPASWQSSNHYEDLEAPAKMSAQDTLYSEAAGVSPYAEVRLPPPHIADLYAEVKRPHPRPPQPLIL